MSGLTHSDLCAIAVKWLKRANSAGGPGCHIAVSECRSGWTGEVPDAIGFRAAGSIDDGSVVVECKTSRSDFLADRKKAHRTDGGCGNWRYFMAPEGIISPDELPDRWGLLTVNSRGHVKAVSGLAVKYRNSWPRDDDIRKWRHEANRDREQFLLTKLLFRVGDPEVLNRNIKIAYAERDQAVRYAKERIKGLQDELRQLRRSQDSHRAMPRQQ
ncbi:adenylosuccinate synthase [Pseudomonas aestusnigri]|uniref:adenylosuccinate synthase n=1 Tax=Halopseudomonas aestusnigri TaxID=857252 RepID=UPI001D1809C9|nr:adenylosuccinate synthase [Halopseudomonas aestusnigri]MCC4260828.1 adenylosuccinate synthase [Halopseudomonas aestusnigri]